MGKAEKGAETIWCEDAGDTEIGCIGEIQGMQVHARIAQHAACRSEATLVVLQENSQLRNH